MTISKGLEGVVVDESAISDVVGSEGRLYYRGYPIEELVRLDFVSVAWLVLFGELGSAKELRALTRFLNAHADPSEMDLSLLDVLGADCHPMRVLQGLLPLVDDALRTSLALPNVDPQAVAGLVLTARIAGLISATRCREEGRPYAAFDPECGFLENLLRSFLSNEPTQSQLETLNVVQILQMEHSFNASTFSCRVTASTLAPVACALSAAVGTLFGRLHGRADEEAMRFALSVGSPGQALGAVQSAIASGEKIMGMGHREYRTVDPRAAVLKPMAERLCHGTSAENLFATLAAIEGAFRNEMAERARHQPAHENGKEIHANLEFYKGAVYQALGIPGHFFTAFFASSRVFGYLAHFLESRLDNRIVRPQGHYTGPAPRVLSV